MRQAIWLGACGLFLRMALAQTEPNLAEILQNVSQTYKAASEYELVADLAEFKTGNSKGGTGHMLFAFKSPSRYRMKMSGDMGDPELTKMVIVHNGSTLWTYTPETNEYDSTPAGELTNDAPGDLGDMAPAFQDHVMMWRYRGATDFVDGAKFLREEATEIGGAKVDCYVVTVSPKVGGSRSVYTWWVDNQRSLILREEDVRSSTVFTSIKLDEPLPDDLFKFEPPPGARKIENQR